MIDGIVNVKAARRTNEIMDPFVDVHLVKELESFFMSSSHKKRKGDVESRLGGMYRTYGSSIQSSITGCIEGALHDLVSIR